MRPNDEQAIMSTTRPIVIAALPREVSAVVKGWRRHTPAPNIQAFEHENAIVAYAGMGAHRARLAVEAALALGPASELISVGFAGACSSSAKVGDILYPSITVDTKTGERFFSAELDRKVAQNESIDHQILVTVPTPANIQQKQYLSLSYYAHAVDMEAAAVARIARARDLPFTAIKAVSDAHDFELPDMSRFTTPTGQLREAAFALHLVTHPHLWKSVATLAKGSTLAANHLRQAIEAKIHQRI
jgi:adenosylhomocysteine nucleosidase